MSERGGRGGLSATREDAAIVAASARSLRSFFSEELHGRAKGYAGGLLVAERLHGFNAGGAESRDAAGDCSGEGEDGEGEGK